MWWSHCKKLRNTDTVQDSHTESPVSPGTPGTPEGTIYQSPAILQHTLQSPCPQHSITIHPTTLSRDYSLDLPPDYEKDCTKAPWRFAYRKLCVFIIALFSILLVGMFVEFWYFSRLHPVEDQGFVCVQCSTLRLSADPLDDYTTGLRVYKNKDIVYCCARNHSQQQQILDALLESKVRRMRVSIPPVAQARISEPPVEAKNRTYAPPAENLWAAQLQLAVPPLDDGTNDYKVVREWMSPHGHGELTFVRRGIQYDPTRGKLIVLRSGLYKLYSHLVFRGPMVEHRDHQATEYSQQVLRENQLTPGHPELLFKDTEMVRCDDPRQATPCHTSNVMGQAYLRQGDEISIIVMPAHLLQEIHSYYGLFRISD